MSGHPTYPDDGVCPPERLPDADRERRIGDDGEALGPAVMDDAGAVSLYRAMVRQRLIDERMLTLQRQGRIGFYGACTGQEAAVFGSARAADPKDFILPALREAGILLDRGFPLRSYFDQLLGNRDDVTQGRQMPCHPPGGGYRYVTMSSVIANQIPQAAGLALACRKKGDPAVVLCFLGDGATSEGDFHSGMIAASIGKLPVVFVCQNNQWSISVPVGRQTAAPSMAAKAKGYGMPGVRVDGNDALAVYAVVRDAVERARAGGGPSFVECLTYRLGAHTTSDDPTRYRDERVTERWKALDPLLRMRAYLDRRGLWGDADETALREATDREIRETWTAVEGTEPPELLSVFADVFAELTPQLQEQHDALLRRAAKAPFTTHG